MTHSQFKEFIELAKLKRSSTTDLFLHNSVHVEKYIVAGQCLRLFQKLNPSFTSLCDENGQIHHEQQIMHYKIFITIYLSNNLVNEAYDLIKPHIKTLTSNENKLDATCSKLCKELIIHFFSEIEKCKIIKLLVLEIYLDF